MRLSAGNLPLVGLLAVTTSCGISDAIIGLYFVDNFTT